MNIEERQFVIDVMNMVLKMRKTRELPHQFELEAITQAAEHLHNIDKGAIDLFDNTPFDPILRLMPGNRLGDMPFTWEKKEENKIDNCDQIGDSTSPDQLT